MSRALVAIGLLFAGVEAAAQAPTSAPLAHGDRVLVRVWSDTAFADSARVDEAGGVVLPRVGRLPIGGLAAPEAVDSIRRAYGRIVRGSVVDVVPLRRVVVSGEVGRPGVYYLEPQLTLREAVAVAGGVTVLGHANRLVVSRGATRFTLKDWARRNDAETIVQSGDVIWVQRESWLKRNAMGLVSASGVLLSVIVALTR